MTNLCLKCKYIYPECYYHASSGNFDMHDGIIVKCSNYVNVEPPK